MMDPKGYKRRRPVPPRPHFELTPETHSVIHEAAQAGKGLDHFSPRALVAYGLTGASNAHFRALETARKMKEQEFGEVVKSVPAKLREGLRKTFKEFLDNNYPEPKKYTHYHA